MKCNDKPAALGGTIKGSSVMILHMRRYETAVTALTEEDVRATLTSACTLKVQAMVDASAFGSKHALGRPPYLEVGSFSIPGGWRL